MMEVDERVPYDLFLSSPTGQDQPRLARPKAACEREDNKRFLLDKKNYEQQFSHIYFIRLVQLRPFVVEEAKARWPGLPVLERIVELKDGQECVVVGTLYKDMRLKPCILEEFSMERYMEPAKTKVHYRDASDFVVMEDESTRIRLTGLPGNFDPAKLVTGIVCGARGRTAGNGEFVVEELCFAGLPPHPKGAQARPAAGGGRRFVLLVSGLHVGRPHANPLPLQLLVDMLAGHLGSPNEHSLAASIVKVIVAGDSVALPPPAALEPKKTQKGQQNSGLTEASTAIQALDATLTALAASVPVDLMPGGSDPCNAILPQQPFHPCLLPGAQRLDSLACVTNPYLVDVDGLRFLGTSGQNILDLDRYIDIPDRCELAACTLAWRHLAPTAPDTLGCYPFHDRDPCIVEHCPHVYFIGNQPNFATQFVQGPQGQRVRVVLLPVFVNSGTAVLVDTDSLDVQLLDFACEDFA
eukprot:gnl/Hemi2/6960_TR2376_c0_g1_i1.p1 gnl/Hemi2/6960_TR2376_c0_g1~~gnl/Hemi2/6960_TR2376_c0_g1_i1.p1  ORF type:complete len:468 (-),score=140.93 gnl/Hemi2/6960_TR2376_c0_g1_i1:203-1606(-)